jgi:serine/threonine protein kinase
MDNPALRQSGSYKALRLGRYRTVARIGKGAMGTVYAADDDMMERQVAIKVMMADIEADPEARTRFYREAKIAGQLMHRNIVTVFDLGAEDGRPFIVMELLKGLTLTEFLSRPEYARLDTRLDLMIQLCEGLAVAHARGIFHRDIKPGNLFVQDDGCLKILDFGIARLRESTTTATGLVMGTPHFMSPEQARGEQIDARSDVFSTGAVCYFMLTGQRPFTGPDLTTLIQNVQFQSPPALPEPAVPRALARIIFRAMSKDRSARYQTAADFGADLDAFRRTYDLQTRRLAESIAAEWLETEKIRAEVHREAIERGLKPPGAAPDPGPSFTRISALMDPSSGSLRIVPFRREELVLLASDVSREHEALLSQHGGLRANLDARRRVAGTPETGESGDLEAREQGPEGGTGPVGLTRRLQTWRAALSRRVASARVGEGLSLSGREDAKDRDQRRPGSARE